MTPFLWVLVELAGTAALAFGVVELSVGVYGSLLGFLYAVLVWAALFVTVRVHVVRARR